MFIGQFTYNLDSKGRLSIPAKLRKFVSAEAQDTFIMTRGINNCIDLYPWDYWQVIAAKLTNLNSYNQKEQLFIRMITSNTFEDKMDSQARILLPQKLLTYSKIEKEVLIIGSLKKIELWSPQVFEEYENSFPETFEQIAEEVMRG